MSDLPEFVADKGPFASFGALLTLLIYRFWPATSTIEAIGEVTKQLQSINSAINDLRTQFQVARQESLGNEKMTEHRLDNLEHGYEGLRSSISSIQRQLQGK